MTYETQIHRVRARARRVLAASIAFGALSCAPLEGEEELFEGESEGEVELEQTSAALVPPSVRIASSQFGGNCEASAVSLASSLGSLTTTTRMNVEGDGNTSSQKTCLLKVVLDLPAGWQYAVSSIRHAASVYLDRGMRANTTMRYNIAGAEGQSFLLGAYAGPADQDVDIRKDLPEAQRIWSPCNTDALLKTTHSVVVRALPGAEPGTTGAYMGARPDGLAKHVYGLVYRRCN